MTRAIAVIPARGGSKRIPRKNIRPFHGKPMIAWSIEVARTAGCFDHVIVSTDDAEIAAVARAHGAEVPFLRPASLSDDHTGTVPVIAHATAWARDMLAQGTPGGLDAVCCLYATAPFVSVDDLRAGRDVLLSGDWDYVFTVTPYAAPIQRAFRLTDGGGVRMFHPEHFTTRSQDLEPAYHDAGQFYWGRPEAWLQHKPLFSERSTPLILPRWRVQDIDTEDDWMRAEAIFPVIRTGPLTVPAPEA